MTRLFPKSEDVNGPWSESGYAERTEQLSAIGMQAAVEPDTSTGHLPVTAPALVRCTGAMVRSRTRRTRSRPDLLHPHPARRPPPRHRPRGSFPTSGWSGHSSRHCVRSANDSCRHDDSDPTPASSNAGGQLETETRRTHPTRPSPTHQLSRSSRRPEPHQHAGKITKSPVLLLTAQLMTTRLARWPDSVRGFTFRSSHSLRITFTARYAPCASSEPRSHWHGPAIFLGWKECLRLPHRGCGLPSAEPFRGCHVCDRASRLRRKG